VGGVDAKSEKEIRNREERREERGEGRRNKKEKNRT